MSIKQKAVKGAVWSAIQSGGSQIGSLLVFFLLARFLTPEAFGLVALANVFLTFMQLVLEQGFSQAIIQRQDLEPEHLNTAFWLTLFSGMILAVVGVISAGWIAGLFGQVALVPIIRCFSLILVITSLARVQQAILERQFNYKAIAIRRILGTFIGGGVGVLLAFLGYGVWSLVAQQFVFEAVGTLTLWVYSDWRPGLKISRQHFHDLFGVGSYIMGFNFLSFFNNRFNDFLVGYFLGTEALGYYSVASKVLNVMTDLLVNTSRDVSLPTFSRLQAEPERFRRALYTVTQLTCAIAFPTFLGVVVLAPELVIFLFGEKWLPSIPIMQALSFVGIARAVTFFQGSVFVSMGKPSWWLMLNVLNVILNLIGFFISFQWGIFAVAVASAIRSFLVFPVGQWAVSRLIHQDIRTHLHAFIAPLASAVAMATALLVIKQPLIRLLNPLELIVVSIVFSLLIFPVGQWSVSQLIPKDIQIHFHVFITPLIGAVTMTTALLVIKYPLAELLSPLGLIVASTGFGAIVYVSMIRLTAPALFQQVLDMIQVAVSRAKPKQNES